MPTHPNVRSARSSRQRRRWWRAIVLALLLAGALRPAGAGETAGSLSEGKQLYLQSCAPCHGADGRGHGPVAEALVKAPPDLTQLGAHHDGSFPRAELAAVMSGDRALPSHGTREMPVWPQRFGQPGAPAAGMASIYARRRLEMLSDYLESIQQATVSPLPGNTPQ